ncbi:hypothetical protein SKAU_G00409810 [Synaphobranchus kaupii]|uniref:PH domain-containing protein n=1 Tax=Synaphobranchus kaupii TaxID=118154 RepID=A0A9Q1IBJ8_SYNKA|nr:hypothetical protein SKAU_G00409810 [Synaphobranchus kaupii]
MIATPGGLKHRCLDPSGVENLNPVLQRVESPVQPYLQGAEQEVKPNTPAISSIQSRLRLFTQRQQVDRFQSSPVQEHVPYTWQELRLLRSQPISDKRSLPDLFLDEGSVYLQLQCEGHSHVQHCGFLTMFEYVGGFAAWQRRWFCLQGRNLSYWTHPNNEHIKAADGIISLSSCSTQSVRPVKRDMCARPHTFELVSSGTLQQDRHQAINRRWFSADTHEDHAEWMEKLNQALLDLHTWSP